MLATSAEASYRVQGAAVVGFCGREAGCSEEAASLRLFSLWGRVITWTDGSLDGDCGQREPSRAIEPEPACRNPVLWLAWASCPVLPPCSPCPGCPQASGVQSVSSLLRGPRELFQLRQKKKKKKRTGEIGTMQSVFPRPKPLNVGSILSRHG